MLSLVIPTYQEASGIEAFLSRVASVIPQLGDACELLMVDDRSPDGTADVAERFFRRAPLGRVIRRDGPRDLSQSVMEGIRQARGELLGVMDADLSHPPELLPQLVRAVRAGKSMAIASRYTPGGRIVNWSWRRRALSRAGLWMARPLTDVTDPMSGYFVAQTQALHGLACHPRGYKILLEFLVQGCLHDVAELPYTFTDRIGGSSKLNRRVVWLYGEQLGRLYRHRLQHPCRHLRAQVSHA